MPHVQSDHWLSSPFDHLLQLPPVPETECVPKHEMVLRLRWIKDAERVFDRFFEEHLVRTDNDADYVFREDLYVKYSEWCQAKRVKQLIRITLGRYLSRLKYKVKSVWRPQLKKQRRAYLGMAWKEEPFNAEDFAEKLDGEWISEQQLF